MGRKHRRLKTIPSFLLALTAFQPTPFYPELSECPGTKKIQDCTEEYYFGSLSQECAQCFAGPTKTHSLKEAKRLNLPLFRQIDERHATRWTMINVNDGDVQGDAHLLELGGKEKKTILVDAGFDGKNVVRFLKSKGIRHLDAVLVTHAHRDHYGGVKALIENRILISQIYFNLPDQKLCDREQPWGCKYSDVQETLRFYKDSGVKVLSAKAPTMFYEDLNVKLELLYAFDGVHVPVPHTEINDTSLILKLTHGTKSALLTGDLSLYMGRYLAKNGEKLEADILKAPHHGGEGAPYEFFERVHPQMVLVPAPKWLWLDKRTELMRKFISDKQIPAFVNGLQGDIEVSMTSYSISIAMEPLAPKWHFPKYYFLY